MHTRNELHEILYVSTIAADMPIRVVADIAAKSRSNNQRLGITGLLVFDGMHFCQQFEGRGQEVADLKELIRNDPRHTDVALLHHGPLDHRRFNRFSLGYTSVEDVDELDRLRHLKGQPAVDAFVALLATLDVDG